MTPNRIAKVQRDLAHFIYFTASPINLRNSRSFIARKKIRRLECLKIQRRNIQVQKVKFQKWSHTPRSNRMNMIDICRCCRSFILFLAFHMTIQVCAERFPEDIHFSWCLHACPPNIQIIIICSSNKQIESTELHSDCSQNVKTYDRNV